jgi:BRCT domain type II-containing protein
MKRIVFWTILVALTGSAGIANTVSDKPFIRVSTTPDELDLGTANFFAGIHEVPGALKVEVESNCLHGPILISTTSLERRGGGLIKQEDIYVRVPKVTDYVSLKKPVVIMSTSAGPQEVVLDFKVHAGLDNPAGQYEGMITLTIVPPV